MFLVCFSGSNNVCLLCYAVFTSPDELKEHLLVSHTVSDKKKGGKTSKVQNSMPVFAENIKQEVVSDEEGSDSSRHADTGAQGNENENEDDGGGGGEASKQAKEMKHVGSMWDDVYKMIQAFDEDGEVDKSGTTGVTTRSSNEADVPVKNEDKEEPKEPKEPKRKPPKKRKPRPKVPKPPPKPTPYSLYDDLTIVV